MDLSSTTVLLVPAQGKRDNRDDSVMRGVQSGAGIAAAPLFLVHGGRIGALQFVASARGRGPPFLRVGSGYRRAACDYAPLPLDRGAMAALTHCFDARARQVLWDATV
jgi:hypothetical protein